MAIRLRLIDSVGLVALCAARSVEKAGDVYLDDGQHYALAEKFWLDYPDCGITPRSEIRAEIEREESNNPNRAEWDKTFATPTHSPGARFEPQPKFVESVPEKRQDLPASPSVPGDGFDVLRGLIRDAELADGEPEELTQGGVSFLREHRYALDALLSGYAERGMRLGLSEEHLRQAVTNIASIRSEVEFAEREFPKLLGPMVAGEPRSLVGRVMLMHGALHTLRTALEAAEADTRRLNWLENHGAALQHNFYRGGQTKWHYPPFAEYNTIREAIDAASQGASGQHNKRCDEPDCEGCTDGND